MNKPRNSRSVLLVTSSIAPFMQADSQRARSLAATLTEAGWDVELLVPGADFQIPIYKDAKADLLQPTDVIVHQAAPGQDHFLRRIGMKSMAWRSLLPLFRLGCKAMMRKKFDLVYITTAQFNFFCLGPLWKLKLGVPYLLDFHDPWFREMNSHETAPRNWKFHVSARLSKYMERFALKSASGLVAVSPVYLDQFRNRYPAFRCVKPDKCLAIPFGVLDRDYAVAKAGDRLPKIDKGMEVDIVYVGAGRSIMFKSFQRICQGLARLRQTEPAVLNSIKIRLFGTYAYWKEGDPKELKALAEAEGVGDFVQEDPARIGYVNALSLALNADGLLVLGIEDPAYMPSKLFLYSMTGKPLLACMHSDSQVNSYFERWPELGTLIHFSGPLQNESEDDARLLSFLRQVASKQTFSRDSIHKEFSAPATARRHAEFFEHCLAQ